MSLNTSLLKICAAAVIAACAVPALAQSASAPASSPAKKELIAKVLQLQQPAIEGLARGVLQQPIGNLMQGAGAALQNQVAPEKREATAKAIEADIKKFVEENTPVLRNAALKLAPSTIGNMLDERFTEDELRQLVAILDSPVNKKYVQMGGDMQSALGQKLMAEVGPGLEGKFNALRASVAKQLGISPPPAASKPATGSTPAKK
ncbi:hypothetical protein [Paucibacter soli]|uniref:hypothetical protein n=1 Tax=Paucibacter soli TaxID=3133433 RepID=UPI0030A499C3